MFFTKFPHPANFRFLDRYDPKTGLAGSEEQPCTVRVSSFEGGVTCLRVACEKRWQPNLSLEPLSPPPAISSQTLCIDRELGLSLTGAGGEEVLNGESGRTFGVSGKASLWQFMVPPDARFYGMGEKLFGHLELSGTRTKFWNTDVWSDFHWGQWSEHPADPPYFSLPYLAMNAQDQWVGFLLHDPGTTFFETPGTDESRVFVEWQRTSSRLLMGSENGEPNLWLITDRSLRGLTRKLCSLVGKTPLPPLWSLGYHQSRWGYGGEADLVELSRQLAKYEIPCDGLWLDLDYMDGYRVFTVSESQFPNGPEVCSKLPQRVVPILDPGIKREPGLEHYDEGLREGLFCKNEEGNEFVGLVWPGETVFPDFTCPKPRQWWASQVANIRKCGFGAFWLDMNDPSTGPVDPTGMRFRDGADDHALHRNQYALGMQAATHEGQLQAAPAERPFLLSRSGFIGTSKYAAVWTGDNLSNQHYLSQCVPTTLGLSISGQPFNGPDVGGFGGAATPELMVRWTQACMLFPFFRNHSTLDSPLEEPWQFKGAYRKAIVHAIRLRYLFLPYLYQAFIRQESLGDPVLRPMHYDGWQGDPSRLDDQFYVGEHIIHAPILNLETESRTVEFPAGRDWFGLADGRWYEPGTHTVSAKLGTTPIFVREGAAVPIAQSLPRSNRTDLYSPCFLICFKSGSPMQGAETYWADDGISFEYQKGARSELRLEADFDGSTLSISMEGSGFNTSFLAPPGVTLSLDEARICGTLEKATFTGKPLELVRYESKR